MPAAAFFGFRFVERDGESARVALPLREEHFQGQGRVHGGVLAALADTAAIWMFLPALLPERAATSIEFKLNFVRPALLERGELTAFARSVQRGRSVLLADVELKQGDVLVAKGLFTYLVVSIERGGATS